MNIDIGIGNGLELIWVIGNGQELAVCENDGKGEC